jgi:hypothetical protein
MRRIAPLISAYYAEINLAGCGDWGYILRKGCGEYQVRYIHEQKNWPRFRWAEERLLRPLAAVRHRQGRLVGHMQGLGFSLRNEAMLQTLTQDVRNPAKSRRDARPPAVALRLRVSRNHIGALVPADGMLKAWSK